ncbi:single-stranded-DNA-specific exonuclease RecJ [Patescibacteria group bacterium]|nr:single-stranded-DNA-specific exonuclease RecJ [Patescibacteria group bacterium]
MQKGSLLGLGVRQMLFGFLVKNLFKNMSILGKNWKIKNNSAGNSVINKILGNRNLTDPEDYEAFIHPDFKNGFHNPFLLKGMDNAVERIKSAIEDNERIIIYGDYDVDGISGAAILILTMQHMGAHVSYRLPHRANDGYGLNAKFIDEFEQIGVSLVVTVDCGISNAAEVKMAYDKGIDIIITDHHKIPDDYPNAAYELIHPMRNDGDYPFKDLTGSGVAFKLAQALLMDEQIIEDQDSLIYALLDLASLGTVADCAPIVGENRLIVKKGLEILPKTRWEGLKALQKSAGITDEKPLTTYNIGFQIGPRINAAGRISSPYYALQLLVQEDKPEVAKQLAEKLEQLNFQRRDMLTKALQEAESRIANRTEPSMIIEYDANWHVGIIGLISGRLTEKYARPSIILQDFGDYLVASARSPEFFNIIEAITKYSKYLEHFGGHDQAAGFKIKKENFGIFKNEIQNYAKKILSNINLKSSLNIDCEIKPNELNLKIVDFIESLSPFGIANEKPVFVLRNAKVDMAKTVGGEQKHMSMDLIVDGTKIRGIAFNMGRFVDYARSNRALDIVMQLEKNEWKGTKTLQMKILDFTSSDGK